MNARLIPGPGDARLPVPSPLEYEAIRLEAESIERACDLVSEAVDALGSTVIVAHDLDRTRRALRKELDKFHERICELYELVNGQEPA